MFGSDGGVEGGFGVETQPHGSCFGDDVLLGHGLLFGETELAEETETVVVGETRSESAHPDVYLNRWGCSCA